jgi:hypothetical protein
MKKNELEKFQKGQKCFIWFGSLVFTKGAKARALAIHVLRQAMGEKIGERSMQVSSLIVNPLPHLLLAVV